VLVHAGAEEAVFLFALATLQAGDHIIVQWPCYQSLHEVARGIGCEVTPWVAREENGWAPDPDELRAILRPGTKAIIVNSPHNPTGYHMSQAIFRALCALAEERQIVLFSDEVYRGLEYREDQRLPAACDVSASAVSLGVMSKAYGLAGLRIGWIATRNRQVFSRIESMKDYTTICCSAPSELLAEVALRHGESIVRRNRSTIATNLDLLRGFFKGQAGLMAWHEPMAGPIAFPRLLRGEVEAFCAEAARACGVLLLPGTVYGDRGNHFRVGFGRKDLPQALARLEQWLLSKRRGPGAGAWPR
jgi:aspartate/methionine/tyrosine aminotransferase